MKNWILILSIFFSTVALAQDVDEKEERRGFQKDKLFTGGSVSLSFFNNSFLVGASPVFGYSITKWLDAGIITNYNYTSFRDYQVVGDKLRQTIYGGGVFTRIFPVRFIFIQGQVEHNWIQLKYFPYNGGLPQKQKATANSVLVGAGYTTGRNPEGGSAYAFLSVMFDVLKERYSPYTDNQNRAIPIIRAGVNIPLFQGRNYGE